MEFIETKILTFQKHSPNMSKRQLSFGELANSLLECTAKKLTADYIIYQDKLELLKPTGESAKNIAEDFSANSQEIENLQKKMTTISGLLKRYPITPDDNHETAGLGSGLTIQIWGEKETRTIFLDSVIVGEVNFVVTLNSPLGRAVFGKKVGDKFSYPIKGGIVEGTIVKLSPYSEAHTWYNLNKKKKAEEENPQSVEREAVAA